MEGNLQELWHYYRFPNILVHVSWVSMIFHRFSHVVKQPNQLQALLETARQCWKPAETARKGTPSTLPPQVNSPSDLDKSHQITMFFFIGKSIITGHLARICKGFSIYMITMLVLMLKTIKKKMYIIICIYIYCWL